jgi:HSP20 family protein
VPELQSQVAVSSGAQAASELKSRLRRSGSLCDLGPHLHEQTLDTPGEIKMTNCSNIKCADDTVRKPAQTAFRPLVDILEVDGDLVLVADIPGADEKHTEVSLEKNILTIKGSIQTVQDDGFKLVHRESRTAGDFERAFTLTREIDRDAIEATVKDGVLRVRLPKSKDAGQKKITVTSA